MMMEMMPVVRPMVADKISKLRTVMVPTYEYCLHSEHSGMQSVSFTMPNPAEQKLSVFSAAAMSGTIAISLPLTKQKIV